MQKKHQITRRSFLFSTGSMSLAGFLPFTVWGNTNIDTPDDISDLKAGPYIQFSGENQITVRWITNVPATGWIEFGNQENDLSQKAESISDGLVDANQTIHEITLNDLLPGEMYSFRICFKTIEKFDPYNVVFGDEYSSQVYSFRAINRQMEKVSFLVFNDIHDRPESFAHLMKYKESAQTDFVLLNGDIMGHIDGEDKIVKNVIQPLSQGERKVPFVYSRGNHETRGKFARQLPSYIAKNSDGYYFSFKAGPVYCIVLDSGEDKEDNDKEYFGLVSFDAYREKQTEWLKKEIQKKAFKKAKYKVVFSHIPPFYSGSRHGTMHCRELWADVLNEAKIDMLISGHTHKYGIHPATEDHHYPIVIGGGPKDGKRTLIEVNATNQQLNLKLMDDQGKVQGELNL